MYISYCTQIKSRNHELTRKEEDKIETLLSVVEYESKRLENFFNEADKTLKSLHSEIVSYKNNKGVSGWNVFLSVAAGAGVGAFGKELPLNVFSLLHRT